MLCPNITKANMNAIEQLTSYNMINLRVTQLGEAVAAKRFGPEYTLFSTSLSFRVDESGKTIVKVRVQSSNCGDFILDNCDLEIDADDLLSSTPPNWDTFVAEINKW